MVLKTRHVSTNSPANLEAVEINQNLVQRGRKVYFRLKKY
jgi:hypothetical protein